MSSRFRFVFIICCFTALLILTVYLRSAANHTFYKICNAGVEQSRLKQKLWRKQLRLESLINPAAVSRQLGTESMSVGEQD